MSGSKTPRDNPSKPESNSGSKQDRHSSFMLTNDPVKAEETKTPFDDGWKGETRRRSNTEFSGGDTVDNEFVMNTEGDEYQPK